MTIPQRIKIGNIIYTISDLQSDNNAKMGDSSEQYQTIKLKNSLSKEKKEETLMHEIVHQILDINEYHEESANEKLVSCLSNTLYQILNDNHLLKE